MSKAYQPLHHKYRPNSFDSLIGQESIAATLKQALKTNRIAPAYLFTGPRGTGKTSSARILARSLNCLKGKNPTAEPCDECDLCKSIALGSSLDVIEIDAASNTGVDNIRELIERSRFSPVQARWKVYVIDECHMLSTAAFNALLKTLEEPPPQVVFILATTDPQRVLPTIVSRCQRFDFRGIALSKLIKHLEMIASKEGIDIDLQAIELIAQKAQGGLRDAESMLDQLSLLPAPIKIESIWDLLGTIPEHELLSLISGLIKSEPITIIDSSRKILDRGRDPIAILQGLASALRDLILIKAAPNRLELISISKEFHIRFQKISEEINVEKLLSWQSKLRGSESLIKRSSQPRLWLEVILLGIIGNESVENNRKKINIEKPTLTIKKSEIVEKPPEKTPNNQETVAFTNENKKEESESSELWQQILGQLELPSTRMLLSQQAKLIRITNEVAVIGVNSNWIGMIQSRLTLLEEAVTKATGEPKKLILESKKESISVSKPKEEELKTIKSPVLSKPNINKINDSDQLQNKPFKANGSDHTKIQVDQIEEKAKGLADFFNGTVLDIDDNQKNN